MNALIDENVPVLTGSVNSDTLRTINRREPAPESSDKKEAVVALSLFLVSGFFHAAENTVLMPVLPAENYRADGQNWAERMPTHSVDMSAYALYGRKIWMRGELRRYENLPADWDGDDGHAPLREDIDNAIAFLDYVPDGGIFSAELMVAGDGDVGFEWDTEKGVIEVGFHRKNISFYGKTAAGEVIKGDEYFRDVVPERLGVLMNKVLAG